MIKQYLDKIKECIANGHLTFAPRDKNVKFMMEYGLLEEDIKDIKNILNGYNMVEILNKRKKELEDDLVLFNM